MAKWTVALFGHNKPQAPGWEKRAVPGDIIAFKPIEHESRWTPTERKEFLIVTIDGVSRDQMEALCEEYWDLNTWKEYDPKDIVADIDIPTPQDIVKKRRFNIPVIDLVSTGVNETAMLDKKYLYNPKLSDFTKFSCIDKINSRYINITDGLNMIEPLIIKAG